MVKAAASDAAKAQLEKAAAFEATKSPELEPQVSKKRKGTHGMKASEQSELRHAASVIHENDKNVVYCFAHTFP